MGNGLRGGAAAPRSGGKDDKFPALGELQEALYLIA